MKHISKEQKEAIIYSYKNGKPVKSLSEQTGIPRSTIYDWIRAEQPISEELPLNKTTINNLKRTNEKQAAIIEVLQRAFDVDSMPTQIRLQMLEELYGEYNVHTLCDALKVPRGTLYKPRLRDFCFYILKYPASTRPYRRVLPDLYSGYRPPAQALSI